MCCSMYNQLTREQRYGIYLGIQEKKTQAAIARQIGVNRSTVSREIRRNSNRHGRYWWSIAHERALDRRERTVRNRETPADVLREARRLLLAEEWSPKQISGYLMKKDVRISHERIYEMIRNDESGELKSHCRHKMKYRRRKKRRRPTVATNIPERVSIHERPAEADGRRFGDWEMDTIVGKGQKSAILTLCERSRNYLIMERLQHGMDHGKVADAVIRLLYPYRKNVLTITTDNGFEFRSHRKITEALKATVYFADSYASWQKGRIENMNKLIRQYIPKGTDFRELSDEFIHSVQLKINRRPREKLNFSTPKDEFFRLLL